MKTPIVLLSIGLLSSSLAGVAGYLAWNSLSREPNAAPVIATAQSQPSLVSPIPAAAAPVTAPAQIHSGQTNPVQSSALVQPAASQPSWNQTAGRQPENDYLFDLSQALQPGEYQRLSSAQQLEMARQIQSWIVSGADFWSLRQQFDNTYSQAIVGDYAHNREVYIRFAAERFAPAHLASLMVPPGPPFPDPSFAAPYAAPYGDPYAVPEGMMPEGVYGQPPFLPPYLEDYGYPPPDAYGMPGPYPGPDYSNRAPGFAPNPYPQPMPPPQMPQRPQAPQPYSPPSPQAPIPNVTEVST